MEYSRKKCVSTILRPPRLHTSERRNHVALQVALHYFYHLFCHVCWFWLGWIASFIIRWCDNCLDIHFIMASNSKLCPSASPATVITDSPLHHINPSFPFPFFVPQCWMSMLPPASGTSSQKSMNWRKGKWFEEEEVYTRKLIEAFNAGLLLIPSGTTLRSFLSEKLSW